MKFPITPHDDEPSGDVSATRVCDGVRVGHTPEQQHDDVGRDGAAELDPAA